MMVFLQALVDALSLGSLYALAALGVGLLFGVLRLINFAYGDFITIAGYALLVPGAGEVARVVVGHWPWPFLIPTVIAVVVILTLLADILVFRPLRQAKPAVLMIASFAIGFIIQNVLIVTYKARPQAVGIWSSLTEAVDVYGLRVPQLQLVTIAVALILLVVLVIFLKWSPFGIQMRAAAEDFRMARMLGVRGNTVIGTAFIISGILAAIVSLLFVAQVGVVNFHMGTPLMIFAFIATVIGGMGSLPGAVAGGYIVGITATFLQILLPEPLRPFRDAFVFAVVIVILVVRPQGLVVTRAARERV
jgi:branched-chain amino acid transport system permease protein